MADLFLGESVDPAAHERSGDRLELDADDLTTHGVIVGMTGSGKTGLGVVLLEEALRSGIPTLVLDPKGDMTNLALRFPGLSAEEFAPWVPAGTDAAATATTWSEGLASWGLDGSHVGQLASSSQVTVFTPGSTAGVPLNLIGSLAAPKGADGSTLDAEAMADEIEGLVTGLLSMVGVDADPLSLREHILLSNLVARAWSAGESLDLGRLVQQVQDPPIRKLGVLELESFYPSDDRSKLALKLNGLLASPAFGAWAEGVAIDIDAMLRPGDGTTPAACSVVYLAHLSEEERQFVVTLLLSKLITWMRSQSGSPGLRAMVYMDEVFGYVPPSAMPPAKKPILTLLKQARAFGVGLVLSTQNPVDLDYKAISNAGTWMIGRLQTERDVDRLSDGLRSASGSVDIDAIRTTIAGLGKREFLLHSTKGSTPKVFTTRWAMDYLAGPLTKDQLGNLPGQPDAGSVEQATSSSAATTTPVADRPVEVGDDEVTVPPTVADGVPVRWVDPASPWLVEAGGSPEGMRLRAGIAARVSLLFDDTKADLRHTETFECVLLGPGESPALDELVTVDYDDRDLRDAAPDRGVYELPVAPVDTKGWFTTLERDIRDHLYAARTMTLPANGALKIYGRPGESAEEFAARCTAAAEHAAEAEAAKVRTSLERRMSTVRSAIEREEIRVHELEAKAGDAKQHEAISVAGDLLGSFLGGRRSAKSILSKVKGASSRRKQTSAAGQRVESALAKVEAKTMELADLEAELIDDLADIEAGWADKAAEVTELEVGLEKTDIDVEQLAHLGSRVVSDPGVGTGAEDDGASDDQSSAFDAPYEAIVRSSVNPFVVLDLDGFVRWASDATEVLLGEAPERYVGRHFLELLAPSSHEAALAEYTAFTSRPPEQRDWIGPPMLLDVRTADGSTTTCEVSASNGAGVGLDGIVVQLRRWRGTVLLYAAVDALAAGAPLPEVLSRIAAIVDHDTPSAAVALVAGWDGTGFAVRAEASAGTDEATSELPDGFLDPFARTDVTSWLPDPSGSAGTVPAPAPDTCWSVPIVVPGDTAPTAALLLVSDAHGLVLTHNTSARRVATLAGLAIEADRSRNEMRHQAHTDHLTGLANRAGLEAWLDARAETSPGAELSMLFCDIDEFKGVNDVWGHVAGDRVIEVVAARLASCVRGDDIVARWGGDEFVVVCTDPAAAAALAGRLVEAVGQPLRLGDGPPEIGISVGIDVGWTTSSIDDLVRTSSQALREAKARGRGIVVDATAGGGRAVGGGR